MRPRQKFSKMSAAICLPFPTPGPDTMTLRHFRPIGQSQVVQTILARLSRQMRQAAHGNQHGDVTVWLTVAQEEAAAGLVREPPLMRSAGQADGLVLQRRNALCPAATQASARIVM